MSDTDKGYESSDEEDTPQGGVARTALWRRWALLGPIGTCRKEGNGDEEQKGMWGRGQGSLREELKSCEK